MNLAYTLGWYQGDFDTAGLPNFAYTFLFNRQRTSGDERHRFVVSGITPMPFGFMFSAVATFASPRPFGQIDGRDINLDNITGDDYPGGTVSELGIRTTMPAIAWNNWYRTVDLRLPASAVQLERHEGQLLGRSVQRVQLQQQPVVRRHAVHRHRRTRCLVRQAHGAYGARQGQVGLRLDW